MSTEWYAWVVFAAIVTAFIVVDNTRTNRLIRDEQRRHSRELDAIRANRRSEN